MSPTVASTYKTNSATGVKWLAHGHSEGVVTVVNPGHLDSEPMCLSAVLYCFSN